MHPVDLTYFAIALFLSLSGLIKWKYRKDDLAARLNRNLKGYVSTRGAARSQRIPHFPPSQSAAAESEGESGADAMMTA